MSNDTLFPFLIGKVLTVPSKFCTETYGLFRFPFLIGKVLTVSKVTKEITETGKKVEKFPFLIGKVLTLESKDDREVNRALEGFHSL